MKTQEVYVLNILAIDVDEGWIEGVFSTKEKAVEAMQSMATEKEWNEEENNDGTKSYSAIEGSDYEILTFNLK